jgi:hypothetical protein
VVAAALSLAIVSAQVALVVFIVSFSALSLIVIIARITTGQDQWMRYPEPTYEARNISAERKLLAHLKEGD